MSKIRLTNRRAGGSFKLPGGIRLRKGKSAILPSSILTHKSVRHLLNRGRLIQSSVKPGFDAVEEVTDAAIHESRDAVETVIDSVLDAVDPIIDTDAAKEVVEDVLDTVEDAVESVVDNALEAVEEAVSGVLGNVMDMIAGEEKEEKPKRRRRKKKADS